MRWSVSSASLPPSKHGLDAVDSIRAMRDGRAKLFVGFAGNFVRATPDSELTEQAMRNCRLTAHISTKLNLSHAVCGETALILPTLGRSDRDVQATGAQFVTVEDSMSIVHQSHGRLTPASEHLLSEVAIVCRLARRTLRDTSAIPWEDFESDYDVIRDAISRVVPDFDDFNDRVRKPGGFRLPNPVNEYRFHTPSGKALFTCNTFDRIRVPAGHLVLQTMRSHDQWNTVPYAPNDRYRGIHNGRRIVLVNPSRHRRAGAGRPPAGRPGEHLGRRNRAACQGLPRDRVSRPRAVRPRRTTPKPMCSSLWTASPTSATHPPLRGCSCGSSQLTKAARPRSLTPLRDQLSRPRFGRCRHGFGSFGLLSLAPHLGPRRIWKSLRTSRKYRRTASAWTGAAFSMARRQPPTSPMTATFAAFTIDRQTTSYIDR